MPTVRVAATGIDLYYEEHGDGPPLLLIFGFTGDGHGWAQQLPAFAPHFRTVIYDNRGVGRSSAPEGAYTIAEMADDAIGLLDAIGIDRAHIVGYSMGGQIAQEIAIRRPDRVDRLVLASTWARGDALFNSVIDVWGEIYRQGVDLETCAKFGFTWLLTGKFLDAPGALAQMLALATTHPFPPSSQGVWGQSRAIIGSDTRDRLDQIEAPALILVGRQDILTPVTFSEELARGIPDATLRVLERGGHGAPFESTADFNQAILDFLTRALPPAGTAAQSRRR
jgi:3-oxoadipate enol-lactonase